MFLGYFLRTLLADASSSTYFEAQSLLSQKKWQEAAIVLRQALNDSPDSTAISLDLVKALVFSGRREEALVVATQAANRETGSTRSLLLSRAKVISRQFYTDQTFQIYQEGVNFLLARKFHNARERFEKAYEVEPDNVEVLIRLGQSLVMEGENDLAAIRLRFAKKLNPAESETHLWLGRALHQRGELPAALEELKLANKELQLSELAPVWLAEAYSSSGNRVQAIQTLEEDLKDQPFHLLGLITLARLKYLANGSDDQALWSARKSLQLAMSRLGQYAKAPPQFESELGLDTRNPIELKAEIETLLQRVDDRLKPAS